MTKIQVTKILRKIQAAWGTFKFWNEPEEVRQDITAAWTDVLGDLEYADVDKCIDAFIANEKQVFAPQAAEVYRLTESIKRSRNIFKQPPELVKVYEVNQLKRGLRKVYFDTAGKRYAWREKSDCIWHGNRWQEKIDFICTHLGGAKVKTETDKLISRIAPQRGSKVPTIFDLFRIPENLKQYELLKDRLLNAAIMVADSGGRIENNPQPPPSEWL